jgi:hypothetical protein
MKSESWLIIQFALVLLIFGVLSFFFSPVYEKGAWAVMTGFMTALGTIMGYKFGRSMPQQLTDANPGQASQSTTDIQTIPDPPATNGPATPTSPAPLAPKPAELPKW